MGFELKLALEVVSDCKNCFCGKKRKYRCGLDL